MYPVYPIRRMYVLLVLYQPAGHPDRPPYWSTWCVDTDAREINREERLLDRDPAALLYVRWLWTPECGFSCLGGDSVAEGVDYDVALLRGYNDGSLGRTLCAALAEQLTDLLPHYSITPSLAGGVPCPSV